MKYFIKTFGCAANVADSERLAAVLAGRGMKPAKVITEADYVVINTCMIRQMAEDRVYGLVRNLTKLKAQSIRQAPFDSTQGRQDKSSKLKTITKNLKLKNPKIVLTGCMVGMAVKEKSGKFLKKIKERMPEVDEFLAIEEVGFDIVALRSDKTHALVPISNGCNNFCTYCVVPFTRGREVSRPMVGILTECKQLKKKGFKEITLVGQNVNSYGADLIKKQLTNNNKQKTEFALPDEKGVKPVFVKYLGRYRIPTLFPYLLDKVAKMGFRRVDFISSNPWDFSDELIEVIKKNKNISRTIHLPVQSGDNDVLKRMNRWYTTKQYLALISKLKSQISKLKISTDLIVGFCGETEKQFLNTVKLAKKAGFIKAYVSMYSDRPLTAAHKTFMDDVPYKEKKKRWQVLENLINKPNLKVIKT